ncbi:protein kinase [Wenzhouxiangella sp. XN201]|uniref:serine/threonine-protein kinase n=1 Tax=Wenzhouxiangella sp. XN201 TaxID=2710755 RepID=UPI0013C7BFF6|nr:serine/threonine-protein kinase [Wenzhouxiangella sp. XN201]NEZ04824.1 protein kinase [Wenzhouxiangella sp. XN201]
MSDKKDDLRQTETRTMTGTRRMLPAGTLLDGRYRIVEVLGVGGMGIVYRAHDDSLDTEVALKLLSEQLAADPVALERFRREIRLARQISHPNVVRIHDIGTDGDLVFMTMDLVPGRTLVEHLADGPLSADQAVGIAIQLSGALAEAHRHGIVHRDIKPSNILVDHSGRAWLTDFGIARALDQQQLTEAGQTIGTVAYMAPEQVRGEAVDARADLYALGLVLWEMLTGKTPLKGETRDETIARRMNPAAPVVLPGEESVPRSLRRTVRRALEPNPDNRYADAKAFADDLTRGQTRLNWRRTVRRSAWAVLIAGLVGVAAMYLPDFLDSHTPMPAAAPSVAILPIVNGTGSEDFDWARNSLAEITAGRLAENRNLMVVEPLRVRRTLADLRLTVAELDQGRLAQLAELLGADWIVQAALLGNAPELRFQVNVFDSADADSSEFQIKLEPDAILDGADQAVQRIVALLEVPAGGDAERLPMSNDLDALARFDDGIDALARSDHQRALDALERAVEMDDAFGMAWARLADARAAAGYYNEALDAAERAAELLEGQGGRAEAWARARLSALAGQTERAIERFTRLVEQYPSDTDAKLALAELLADQGQLQEAARLAEEVSEIDANHPRAWFLLGKFAVMSGNVQRAAEDYFVKALVIQNRLANIEGRAEVLNGLGIAHERLGELDVANDYYGDAAELRQQAGDRRGHAASLSNVGRLNMIRGRYDLARDAIDRALDIREEIGDLAGLARTYNELGVLEEEVGHYDAARGHYRDALRTFEQLGSGHATAGVRTSLAFMHLMLGEYETAEAFAQRAKEQQAEAGDSQGLMSSLHVSGELEMARGDWSAAQASLLRSLEMARELGNPFGEATAHGSIGLLAGYQGRIDAALDAFDTAIELLEPLDDRRGLAEYHLRTAEVLASLDLLAHARPQWQRAQEYFADQANLSQRARLVRIEAALRAPEDASGAAAVFDEALQLARSSGSEPTALMIRISRLRRLGGNPADFEELATSAEQLGHRPMQLQALTLLADNQLESGSVLQAQQTVSQALRPPLELDPWVGNWQLHAILERTESPSEALSEGDSLSRTLLLELASQMPPELQTAFREMHGL